MASFMIAHLGYPIPPAAIMEKMGTALRRALTGFADTNHIPVVRFHNGDLKIDFMGRYLSAQAATARSGMAAIGVAQEYQNVFAATQRERSGGSPSKMEQYPARGKTHLCDRTTHSGGPLPGTG